MPSAPRPTASLEQIHRQLATPRSSLVWRPPSPLGGPPTMKRRTFLQMSIPLAAATLALPACQRIEGSVEKPLLPLVLRGGRSLIDGQWRTVDRGLAEAGK